MNMINRLIILFSCASLHFSALPYICQIAILSNNNKKKIILIGDRHETASEPEITNHQQTSLIECLTTIQSHSTEKIPLLFEGIVDFASVKNSLQLNSLRKASCKGLAMLESHKQFTAHGFETHSVECRKIGSITLQWLQTVQQLFPILGERIAVSALQEACYGSGSLEEFISSTKQFIKRSILLNNVLLGNIDKHDLDEIFEKVSTTSQDFMSNTTNFINRIFNEIFIKAGLTRQALRDEYESIAPECSSIGMEMSTVAPLPECVAQSNDTSDNVPQGLWTDFFNSHGNHDYVINEGYDRLLDIHTIYKLNTLLNQENKNSAIVYVGQWHVEFIKKHFLSLGYALDQDIQGSLTDKDNCMAPLEPVTIQQALFINLNTNIQEPTVPKIIHQCDFCKKDFRELLRCSRCKKVRYCSVACQKSDWPNHKKICRASSSC